MMKPITLEEAKRLPNGAILKAIWVVTNQEYTVRYIGNGSLVVHGNQYIAYTGEDLVDGQDIAGLGNGWTDIRLINFNVWSDTLMGASNIL